MDLEQLQWLIGEGRRHLDPDHHRSAPVSPSSSLAVSPLSPSGSPRRLEPWQQALLEAQRALRYRSRQRFPDPAKWLWTDRSLQQATDWASASFKASLIPSGSPVIDACCGAGADLVALATAHPVQGVDRDPLMIELARANACSHSVNADFLEDALPSSRLALEESYLHIDPDRRPDGARSSRTIHGEAFSPTLQDCITLGRQALGCIIKLAPATELTGDRSQYDGWSRCWLGSQKSCPQQLLIRGTLDLSIPDGQRAAVLVAPQPLIYFGTETNACPTTQTASQYVYDLHAALHASGLASSWACSEQLTALEHPGNYLTGSREISSPWAQSFRVLEQMAWDDRRVRKWLRQRNVGPVEVKTRHVTLDANELQLRLSNSKHPEGKPITCLLYRSGKSTRVILAERP